LRNGESMKKSLMVLGLTLMILSLVGNVDARDKKDKTSELEAKVKLVMNPDHVEDCELLGIVEAKARATLFTGYKKNKRAYVKLRKKAVEMGGNTILLFESQNKSFRTRLQGEVYLCPDDGEQKPEDETEK